MCRTAGHAVSSDECLASCVQGLWWIGVTQVAKRQSKDPATRGACADNEVVSRVGLAVASRNYERGASIAVAFLIDSIMLTEIKESQSGANVGDGSS
jgi:hypothetical protein